MTEFRPKTYEDIKALFEPATGKDLDRLANTLGFERKRWLWGFKEPDRWLAKRLLKRLRWNIKK
jgi:hypothetical protein